MNDASRGRRSVYDLHTHSTASDGFYPPAGLVARAAAAGIEVLALTDHDTTAGLKEAGEAAREHGLQLITGVEISTTWQGKTLHVVGLHIDPACAPLQTGLRQIDTIRAERAREIGWRLEKAGIPGILEDAEALAGNGMLTRRHFAQCLARRGLAMDVRDVFNRYLTNGKPGYVATHWADLDAAIGWIRAAGGFAVLAHPQRYPLTVSWLRRLLSEFLEMGGTGLEVVSGAASPGDIQSSTALALRFDLLASCGSDFHGPEEAWPKLGCLPALPIGLTPVWQRFEPAVTAPETGNE